MSAKQELGGGTPPKEITSDQPAMTPDEDGPHDVPDDEVIEATLPSGVSTENGHGD